MENCVTCGEPVDETNSAVCHGCERRYHLVLKQNEQGKDCGTVWVDDLSTSLVYACSNCLKESGADATPPAVGTAASETTASRPPSRARRARSPRRYRKR